MKRLATLAACAAVPIGLLIACSPHKPAAPASLAKYNTDALDMKEFMGHVVDPASFAYWKGSGTEETAKGTTDLTPTTDAGWEGMETAAAVLIEAGNALQLPGRPRAPEADFDRFAQQLTAEAVLAKAAAANHDKAGVYSEGAKIYLICTACHKEYVIDPGIKANGPAPGNPLPDWPADIKAKQQAYKPKPAA
ncbi:MAG: hypothetical protein ACHP9T_12020 [Caulobacterales bacterium]